MPSNGTTLRDEEGDSPDWFELFNPGPEAVELGGWTVSDDPARPRRWTLPAFTLPAGGFRLVYASGKDRAPTGVAPMAPESLDGLRFRLSASGIDPERPEQVRRTAGADYVLGWKDEQTGDLLATQPSAAAQPRWIRDGFEGRPVVRFDGRDDQLRLPDVPAAGSFCLFVVCRPRVVHQIDDPGPSGVGGTSGQHYLFGAQHGGDLGAGAGLSAGINGVSVYEHGSAYMPAVLVYRAAEAADWLIVAVNYDERAPSLDVNGALIGEAPPSPRSPVTAPIEIGSGAYGAFNGDVAEILLFDRSLTVAERGALAAHFAAEFDIPLLQPWHTNFQLDADGESLVLSLPDGTVADRLDFERVPRDVSFGRPADTPEAWAFFAEPTPGAANVTPASHVWLSAPEFSHAGGFHPTPIDLELRSDNPTAKIRYTLDGSEPTAESPLYTTPLALVDRSNEPNRISAIPTVPGGSPPVGRVFKGWVVRARAFADEALPSPPVTRTFWIDPRGPARYTLPVVSLAVDPDHFFDPDQGIYVPGNASGGNYSQRGPDWERPMHIELYETDGQRLLAQDGDVKIHGNTSQGFPIKGLDLDGTGGRGRAPFAVRLFPDQGRDEFEHFLLRPTGHDQQFAFMRDELMQSLAAESGAEYQAARPCVVFIDGEYWGLHYLKEKEDAEFVAFHGNVPEDELDYLEGYAAAKAGDTAHYDAMLAYLAANPPRNPAVLDEVGARMEIDNYIDYKVHEIFFYRWDIGNHRLWRPRTPDGRWRWLQFDNDVGWGGFWAEQPAWDFDMLAADLTPDGSLHGHNNETTTFLLRRLMENPTFRHRFINRFADLLNTTLAPEHTIARIDAMAAGLNREMPEHIKRWRYPSTFTQWRENVEYLREFARRRPDACRTHLIRRFGLRDPARLTLDTSPVGAGTIRVNTLDLDPGADGWNGLWFQGLAIEIEGRPATGYRWDRWDGLPGITTNRVQLELNGDLALTAVFRIDPALRLSLSIERASGVTLMLRVVGPPDSTCRVQHSADLRAWIDGPELTFDSRGAARLEVPLPSGPETAFYRARVR
ncbi:MAG: CotH kinase family protein [Verrucomicrobiales bacterium]|nr:CotH kinase family protein [Verrucomicrobiales bacterium]